MKRQALLYGIFTAATLAWPALAADGAPGMMELRWGKNAFNFEGLPSGPQPLKNLSRRPDGSANAGRLVGDYNNPILTPDAAAVVKQKGELAAAGRGFPNSQDQCRPIAPPFTFAMQLGFVILPEKDGNIAFMYDQNANIRHVRMNGTHPANFVSSSMGDSVGHWEGDTLVIDTVGVKVDRFTSVDRFGTPQSPAMHVIERYRLIDGPVAKAQVDQYEYSEGTVGGGGRNGGGRNAGYNPDASLKGLELDVTMEDPKVFTQPLTARVTYRRLVTDWTESVCADNPMEHYKDEWIDLPRAQRSDF
jgi:hypothetical protein